MKVKLLNVNAMIPSKSNKSDAGWDLYAIEDATIMSSGISLIRTGIALAIPDGCVGLLKGRSGLGLQGIDPTDFFDPETHPTTILGGVIDSGYRGEIGVIVKNLGAVIKYIKKGDRVCQILILPIWTGVMEESSDLSESERGEKGYGSSSFEEPERKDIFGYLK